MEEDPSLPSFPKLKTLEIVQKRPGIPVFHIYLNSPSPLYELTPDFFSDLPAALSHLDHRLSAKAIVLTSRGPHFCPRIVSQPNTIADPAIRGHCLRRTILGFQAAVSALERCRCPVIAAVHGGCLGGGVELVAACDLRYCTDGALFSVTDVEVGLAPYLGSLQRLPAIEGYGNTVEMALTGRKVGAGEAKAMGLVSRVFASREEMVTKLDFIARKIAGKPPLAAMGTKELLLRSRDLMVEQGLDYVANWNAWKIESQDLQEAMADSSHKQ